MKGLYNIEDSLQDKIITLLLKKEMSISDLAEVLYGKRNVKSSIDRHIKRFLEKGLIRKIYTDKKTILYTCTPKLFGVGGDEYKFILLIIRRFWNVQKDSSLDALKDLLLQLQIIKESYKIKKSLFGYNPTRDFKVYQKDKDRFWKDEDFRFDFLNKIKGSEMFVEKSLPYSINRDFLFCGYIFPDGILGKIENGSSTRLMLEIIKSR